MSVKTVRLLEELGVVRALESGNTLLPVGPEYRLESGDRARLVFLKDDDGSILVGYAVPEGAGWRVERAERFSSRRLGYYLRRLKRLARESFRRHQAELPAADLVVNARPAAAKATNAEIVASLDALWTRIAQRCARS